jgi:hypothetical protein
MEFLAQASQVTHSFPLPDPNHFASVGWVIVILVAVLVGANQVITFYKDHISEKPRPADTYVTIPNFNKIEEERKADRKEIKETLKQIADDLGESNRYQAKARQKIHHRQNAMENALAFIAGRFEHNGDHAAAAAIQQKLTSARWSDES